MWDWMPLAWFTFVVLLSVVCIYAAVMGAMAKNERNASRCEAAQQTIIDEAEMIAAGGKFTGDQVTDRWKKLLGGC